jgi:hypothetical protein
MAFRRATVIVIGISISLAPLAALISCAPSPSAPAGGGYALVTCEEAFDDRHFGALLQEAGIDHFSSESGQWVFLNDFTGLLRIPLDGYDERVFPFDPRRDGYAEKLHAFFVSDGRRRFFIPLPPAFSSGAAETLEQTLSAALAEVPSVEISFLVRGGYEGSSPLLYLLLFLLAALLSLPLSGAPVLAALFLPLGAAFSWTGPAGLALSACLAALFRLFLEPARNLLASALSYRATGTKWQAAACKACLWEAWRQQRPALFFQAALALLAACLVIAAVRPLLALSGLVCFAALFAASLYGESRQGLKAGHIRFRPVPIRRKTAPLSSLGWVMLPFALASLAALMVPRLFPAQRGAAVPVTTAAFADAVSRADWEAHVAFQTAFSYTPLGSWNGEGQSYLRYATGADGLFDGATEPLQNRVDAAIPPFPLEDIVTYITASGETTVGGASPPPPEGASERIPVYTALALCLAAFVFRLGRFHQRRTAEDSLPAYSRLRRAA